MNNKTKTMTKNTEPMAEVLNELLTGLSPVGINKARLKVRIFGETENKSIIFRVLNDIIGG